MKYRTHLKTIASLGNTKGCPSKHGRKGLTFIPVTTLNQSKREGARDQPTLSQSLPFRQQLLCVTSESDTGFMLWYST